MNSLVIIILLIGGVAAMWPTKRSHHLTPIYDNSASDHAVQRALERGVNLIACRENAQYIGTSCDSRTGEDRFKFRCNYFDYKLSREVTAILIMSGRSLASSMITCWRDDSFDETTTRTSTTTSRFIIGESQGWDFFD